MNQYEYQIWQAAFHIPYTLLFNHNFFLLTRMLKDHKTGSLQEPEQLAAWHGLATAYNSENGKIMTRPVPLGGFFEKLYLYHCVNPFLGSNIGPEAIETLLGIQESPYHLRWWLDVHETSLKPLASGSQETIFNIWKTPETIMSRFNQRQTRYASFGLGVGFSFFNTRIGEICTNSNSVFRMLGESIMKLSIQPFSGRFQPGYENLILTQEEIKKLMEEVQDPNLINSSSLSINDMRV